MRPAALHVPVIEELEPRILLSAGIHSALLGDVLSNAITVDYAQFNADSSPDLIANDNAAGISAVRQELVFVDAATPDYEQLVEQLLAATGDDRNIDVIIIDSGSDGIEQISQALMGYANLDAVHVISHGTDGGVQLGNSSLDNVSLAGYANLISGWGDALNVDADVLFYGCDLAAGEDGRGLIAELAALTGADIAASDDITGHASLGGDWDLEHRTGLVETALFVQENWVHALDVTVDSASSGVGASPLSLAISHTTSGSSRLMLVAISIDGGPTDAVSSVTYNGVNLTLVGSYSHSGGQVLVELWSLVAPDTGTYDVIVNTASAPNDVAVGVTTFNGVDQLSALGTFTTIEGNSNSASVNVSSTADDLVFGFVGVRKGADATPGPGQTEHSDVSSGNIETAVSTEGGSASVVTSWLLDSNDKWVAAGISINAAADFSLWLADEASRIVEDFGGDGFSLENPATAGTFSSAFDLGIAEPAATTNINALHYVGSTISVSGVGITSMTLNPGDIIFSVDGSDTLGGVAVAAEDLVVFRPTTPGDYSSGTFVVLSAGLGASNDITAFSLVETPTAVPGSGTLAAGDFIYVAGSGGDTRVIRHYDASTGLNSVLVDGDVDAVVGFKPGANVITGIDLIETDITIGGRSLTAGQILVTLTDDDVSVGNLSGNISVTDEDIFVLDLVSASDFSASLLFDGSDVGYLGDVNALTIAGVVGTGPSANISGTVYEDINGDGNLTDAVGVAGVDVDLYLDDGDGVIDAGDTFIATTTTDGSGNFTLTGTGDGTYWIVVDSTTVSPNAGFLGGFDIGYVWAEQTWASTGAVSFDGSFNYLGTSGVFYGGMQFEVSDDASALATAEHVTRAIVSGANIINVNSGFSFNAVTRTGDGDDDLVANRSMQGSLRQFIQNSNAIVGVQATQFAIDVSDSNHYYYQNDGIAGSLSLVVNTTLDDASIGDFDPDYPVVGHSWFRIQPTSALPIISDAVIIDGYTQFGASPNTLGNGTDAVMKIEINGDLSANAHAFVLNASNSQLSGLVINGNFNIGITVLGDNNTISGNYIGTDITGTHAPTATFASGVQISLGASNNTIGGPLAADRNVVSGTTQNAIWLLNSTTQSNTIRGNYIGVNAMGDAAIANTSNGIVLTDGTHDNTVQDNVISGNNTGILLDGIISSPSFNTIIGNMIGTDATGTFAVANAIGIWLQNGVANTTIGGSNASQRNIISGNTSDGIRVHGAGTTGNVILGNYIGTNISGTAALNNGGSGIEISDLASANTIGGTAPGAGNLLSGNTVSGVAFANGAFGNFVQGNYIGVDVTSTAAIGNGFSGVRIFSGANNNTIGGTAVGAGNVISGNSDGIYINGVGSSGNVIQGNLIGTDVSGTIDVGNNDDGIEITAGASNNLIGGTVAGARNIISGNNGDGISITGAGTTANRVYGNYIGTDLSGNVALGNGNDGIDVQSGASGTLIGTVGWGNVVSGNGVNGINISSDNNTVVANYVGTNAAGTAIIGNVTNGVLIDGVASGNTIGGTTAGERNILSGNGWTGITIIGATAINNFVTGNYIGTDVTGTTALGNVLIGIDIRLGASGNVIGGTAAGEGNLISGNTLHAISINDVGTDNNRVEGNIIGLDATGTVALGNGQGIWIHSGASNNAIGGTAAGAGNVISGNSGHGVHIAGAGTTGNTVEGNYIGTNAAGDAAIANTGQGVLINAGATGNTVGGTVPGARNVISGNLSTGVYLQNIGTTGNFVQGNYIGTNAAGDAAIANGSGGVRIADFASGNTIGGTAAGAGNLISGNSWGVQIFTNAFNNFVQGNLIGTDWTGTAALANTGMGIAIQSGANGNTIGGTVAGAGNVIAYNLGPGVQLTADAGTGNAILGNSIHSNTGLGIDLQPGGVTPNDPGDVDTGPNDLQNFPVLLSAVTDGLGTITIQGTLNGVAITTYRIELFANAAGDISGNGEGEIYLGFVDVTTDATGNASFTVALTAVIPPAHLISATATDPVGNTSEFAANIAAVSLPPVLDLDANDSSGSAGADYNADYIENGGPVLIVDSDGTLVDPDTLLQWLTVTITNLLDGAAELLAADTSFTSIIASYDSMTGILLLSGADTAANYQQVLRTISYDNSSDDPDITTRVIEFVANDGESSSNLATTMLTISAINDAPVLTPASPALPTINEDALGNGGFLISTLLGGSVSDPDSGALQGIAVTGLNSSNGSWEYSTDGGFTWIAVAAVSDSNALLLRASDYIRFVPDGNNADSASFDFRAWDQTSGLFGTMVDASVNGGITAFSTASDTATTTVTAVNDAPVLTPAAPALPTINEDATGNGGVLISTLLGVSVNDVDTGSLQGIAVTGLNSSNGSWEYSTDGGFTWIAVGAVSDSNALLLRASDYIRFVPDTENADTASFDYRAWDQTSGLFGTMVDASVTGGITAFSSASDTATITVTAVNDAPVLTPATPALPTINEDATGNGGVLISTLLGVSVSDIDTGSLQGIAVTGLNSSNGSWEYSTDGGFTWIAVGAVSDSNALLLRATDYIRFVPDGNNADSASFDFRAWDQTSGLVGTLADASVNGGITAFSSASDTATITVTAVNDAPVLTPATPALPTINEDDIGNGGVLISTLLGGSVSDPDTGALQGIAVTGLNSSNGTWEYSTDGGFTWIAVGAVSDSSALLLRATDYIRFVPDGNNGDSASFDFRAWDQTSGLAGTLADASVNGGITAFSSASDTATTTVTAVNDAPVLTPATPALPTINEDALGNGGSLISTLLGVSVSDVDTGALQGIAVTGLNSSNGTWEYSTDGGFTWISVAAVSDSNALLLRASDYIRFVPDGNNADSASFDFRAWDQTSGVFGTMVDASVTGGITAFSSVSDTATITVTAVNDAPVLTPATPTLPTINEDATGNGGILISTLLGVSVSDVDTGALQGIAVTGLNSSNGTWEYSTDGGFTWISVAAVSDSNALLLRASDYIRFVPDGNNADSASFDFRAWDQTSGVFGTMVDASTNGGITAFSTVSDTATITVTAINDAPVLTPATPILPTINEDAIGNAGVLISTLLGVSVSDVDTGALQGIAVTGLNSSNGTWEYSTDGGFTWIAVGAVSDSNALLLRATDYIRFVPDGNNGDSASFNFRAWDQTSGLAGTLADASVNGGITAFSSASDKATITVTAVNDAPVLTPATPALPTINEDDIGNGGVLISTLLGGSVSDPDTGALQGVAITGLNSSDGTWEYSTDGGFTWISVAAVSDSNALLLRATDYIRFVPDGNNGDSASFNFRAWDQTSGLAGTLADASVNGGITAFSSASDTATITVTAVNDAPVLTPATPALPTINEDDIGNGGVLISTLLGGSVSDPDTGALQGVAITGLNSSNGSWEYSTDGGFTWIAVGAVSDSNALLLRASDYIRFVPDGNNADSASFDFRAWDQTSGVFGTMVDASTNGGITAFSTVSDTATITVTAVNDAPLLAPTTPAVPTINEDAIASGGVLISTLLGGSVSDVDTGALQGIAITGLNSSNGNWEYSTDGGFTWIAVAAVSDSNALLLRASDYVRFVPDAENADTASFEFRAWDQTSGVFGTMVDASVNGGITAYSTAIDTANIIITAVNDAPILTATAPSLPAIDENNINNAGIAVSTLLGASVSDVDIGSQAGIAITGLSSGNGTWQYSLDGITWIDMPAVSDNAALVLSASDRIRFVPDGGNVDNASFTFRAWDWTGGTAGLLMDTTINGGASPFSASSDTASITVTAINDLPTTTGLGDVAVNEDSAPVVIDLYSAFSDIEDLVSQLTFSLTGNSDPSLFSAITFDTVAGTLTLNLTPDANGQTTITVRAVDTDGGLVESTFVLDINAVNDAPVTTGPAGLLLLEDGPAATFDLYTLFSDIDDLNSSLTFSIVGNDNAVLTTAGIDAATGALNLNFGADLNGSSTLTLRATDAAGAFVDSTFLVTVDAVDDAAVNFLPDAQTVSSGQFVLFSSARGNSISVSDIDSTNVTVSLSVPNGLLRLANTSGLTFSVGDGSGDTQMTFTGSVSDVNAALDGLVYQAPDSFNGFVALQVSTWSADLPQSQRAPVSSETLNIVVLEAIELEPSDVPNPDNLPVDATTGEKEKDDDVEAELETESPAPETGNPHYYPTDEFAIEPVSVFVAPFNATPINEIPRPDNGIQSPSNYTSRVAQALLQLSDAKLPAFVVSDAVWDAIDAMRGKMDGLDRAAAENQEFLVKVAAGFTLTLSAGFVSWMMRAGALMTSLLSTTPMWQRFDPLPVLDGRRVDDDDDEKESGEKDADAVKAIFGANT